MITNAAIIDPKYVNGERVNSMKIIGTDGLSSRQIHLEVAQGAKFVAFQYCVSLMLMTYKRSSDIYFVRSGQTALIPRVGYSLISLFFGWWGIPWGPIYTVQALWNNAIGGVDLTPEILSESGGGSNT